MRQARKMDNYRVTELRLKRRKPVASKLVCQGKFKSADFHRHLFYPRREYVTLKIGVFLEANPAG